MPTFRVTTRRGWIADPATLADRLRLAAMAAFAEPASKFSVALVELDEAYTLVPAGRGRDFTIVEVLLFPGRTKEMRRALFRAIAAVFGEAGLPAGDLDIFLVEVDPRNAFIAGAPIS
jgi:phenylpyruvate tautomerase PptA (4-oxalocrotonate tautomerase family)